jgi:hypothetical protein
VQRRDVRGDQADRGGEHGRVVGEADHRQHVGNDVEGQHEIGERAEERRLHLHRRVAVEAAATCAASSRPRAYRAAVTRARSKPNSFAEE